MIAWLAASALATSTVLAGQLGVLLAVPATLAWREARKDRWGRAGMWLGVVVSAKLFALLPLAWLALAPKRRRGLGTAVASIAAVTLAGMVVFGVEAYGAWLRQLAGIEWWWAGMNASIAGVAARALAPSPLFVPVVDAPWLVAPIAIGGGVAVIGGTLVVAQRADVDRAFALLWIGALLASPLGWIYYGWLAVGPAWAMFDEGRLRGRATSVALVALLMPPYLVPDLRGGWWTVTFGSAYFVGLAVSWWAVLTASRDRCEPRDT